MALQGTIDTFPLTDVLGLLASSKKSGRLVLDGDRGRIGLWVEEGDIIGGDMAGASATAPSLLFELLRFSEAGFAFDLDVGDDTPECVVERTSIADGLRDAEALIAEWDAIAAVVPSLAHRIELVDELPGTSVTLDAATWRLVLASSVDPVVAVVGDALGLDEFGACAAAAGLVEMGLATIGEPIAAAPAVDLTTPAADGPPARAFEQDAAPAAEPAEHEPTRVEPVAAVAPDEQVEDHDRHEESDEASAPMDFPERFPIDDLLGGGEDADDAWGSPEMERLEAQRAESARATGHVSFDGLPPLEATPFARESAPGGGPDAWDDLVPAAADPAPADAVSADDSTDEVLRQMSKLSPQAAEAIAAALNTVPAPPTPAAAERPADERSDGEGPVTFSGLF